MELLCRYKKNFNSVDVDNVGNPRYVFNIKGNALDPARSCGNA